MRAFSTKAQAIRQKPWTEMLVPSFDNGQYLFGFIWFGTNLEKPWTRLWRSPYGYALAGRRHRDRLRRHRDRLRSKGGEIKMLYLSPEIMTYRLTEAIHFSPAVRRGS